jgi:ATP-binding cassette, subfamily B, bacterial
MGRISELLVRRASVADPAQPEPLLPRDIDTALRFEAIAFRYPSRLERDAVNLSLSIRTGETVALVGRSGAGKSTLFQLLLRFYDPQSGSIYLRGQEISKLSLSDLRASMAIVPQDPVIFAGTIADNIRYGKLDATEQDIARAADLAEASEFISSLPNGLQTQVGERGLRLSGGQQQRLVIARAILKDAPILLLDEATSALDAQSERAVQKALDHLMQGRTTLVIAHRLATVVRADRIVVLNQGQIVDQGTHQQLIQRGGLYAELAKLQFQIEHIERNE